MPGYVAGSLAFGYGDMWPSGGRSDVDLYHVTGVRPAGE